MTTITESQIMQNWHVDNTNTPLVSINCITYNQELYLAEALNGFIMQKTDFPFEVIIHDDASTDKTADIIREYEANYPKIIKPFYETENQYSKHNGSFFNLINAKCKGKYIAMCEGDDYWTDENKLQIQVDFLEKHPDFSLCSHRYKKYYQNENRWEDDDYDSMFAKERDGFIITTEINYLKCWCTKTMTLMYRKNCIDINTLQKYKHTRDVHLNYHLLSQGNGYCLPFTGAVYRINDGGIWGNLSQLQKSITNFWVYEELYYHNQNDKTIKKVFQNYINKLVFDKIASHDLNNSTRSILKKIIHTLLIRKEFKKIISFIKICLIIYRKKENFYRFC